MEKDPTHIDAEARVRNIQRTTELGVSWAAVGALRAHGAVVTQLLSRACLKIASRFLEVPSWTVIEEGFGGI